MASKRRNGVWYEGRVVGNTNAKGQSRTRLSKSQNGRMILDLVIAEGFDEKNKNLPADKQDPAKGPEDYVNASTAWHKVRIIDSDPGSQEFLDLITNPKFNHGAVVTVDATYREDVEPWVDGQGVTRVGRQETIFIGSEDGGLIEIKVLDDGRVLGARDEWEVPIWDGSSEIKSLGGTGGPAAPSYRSDEGF